MNPDTTELDTGSLSGLWDFGDPAASEARFRQFASRADAGLAACAQTQTARAIGLQRRFDEALALLDEIIQQNPSPETELAVRLSLERGRVLNSSGTPSESITHFEHAWTTAKDTHLDGLAVDAAHMLGIVVKGQAGMAWNERALELAITSDQPAANTWQGSLLNNMGWSYHEAGNFDRALELFTSALDHRLKEGKKENIRIAKWCIGRCLRSLDRFDEALAIHCELQSDPGADGYVYEELGECLLSMEETDQAKPNFAKAYEMLSKDAWLVANDSARLARLKELGSH
jgi:tetratricopeptide (TPR) repeat protein